MAARFSKIDTPSKASTLVGEWFEEVTKRGLNRLGRGFSLKKTRDNVGDLVDASGLRFEVKSRSHGGWLIWENQFEANLTSDNSVSYVLWKWRRMPGDLALYRFSSSPKKVLETVAKRIEYGVVLPQELIAALVTSGLVTKRGSQVKGMGLCQYMTLPFDLAYRMYAGYTSDRMRFLDVLGVDISAITVNLEGVPTRKRVTVRKAPLHFINYEGDI